MSDRFRSMVTIIISAAVCLGCSASLTAFAASDGNSDVPSKGVTAAVIIGLFVAVSIVSAIITYKVRMKGSGKNSDNNQKED